MKIRSVKMALYGFLFCLLGFGSFKFANASLLVNQTGETGYIISDCIVGGSATQCWNSDNSNNIGWGSHSLAGWTSGHFLSYPTTNYVGAVAVKLKKKGSANIRMYISCAAGGGSNVYSDNTLNTDTLSSVSYSEVTFNFTTPNACDLATYPVFAIGFETPRDSVYIAATDVPNSSYPYLGVGDYTACFGGSPCPNTNYQPWLVVADSGGFPTFAIDSPSEFSTLQRNSLFTISGTCLTNGHTVEIGQTAGSGLVSVGSGTCSSGTFSISVPTGSGDQVCYKATDVESEYTTPSSSCYFLNDTGEATISSITWSVPPFSVSSSSPLAFAFLGTDFSTWQLGITIQPRPSITGYYYKVFYGTSSPATYVDSLKSQVGILPLTQDNLDNGLNDQSSPLNKLFGSSAGEWSARAYLYDQNDATIASSSLLTLSIIAGATTTYPSNLLGQDNANCPASSFQIFSVDYGQGLCKSFSFLFSPSQSDMTRFSSLWDGIKQKPPFGWFSVSQETISGINTTTPASLGLLSMSWAGSFKTVVDTGLALLSSYLFLLFVWNRFRKFNFH